MQDRSDTWTTGLCDIIDSDRNKRLCFFEIDEIHNKEDFFKILEAYKKHQITVLFHRTKLGWHFLGVTEVTLEKWKAFQSELKEINKHCPMVCMRVEPNKHPNESNYWYKSSYLPYTQQENNNREVCIYLNHIFGSELQGTKDGKMKIVRYRLPKIQMKGSVK